MTRPAVTIVIPVWNAAQTTSNCLSVLRRTLGPDDQVVVVDNGSRDETPRLLAKHDWIEVVTHEENKGFAGGCNAGARQARNPIVIFLNNDTVPAPGWIEGLVAPFADPEVGATGPVSNMAAGYQYLADEGYRPTTVAEIVRYTDEVRRKFAGQWRDVDLLIGFCLAVRTSVFTELGGFDESFGIGGCEDDDLCNRLRFAGWKLVVTLDTFVHHIGHQTFEANELDWLAIEGDNEARLGRKMDASVPVSFVVLCGSEPVPLIATLVGIQETMGAASYEVVLLVPDREPLTEVLEGVDGVTVVDVPGVPEDRAWQLGHHTATGLRRAMLRAGEAVDVAAVARLVDTDPLRARPTAVGTEMQAPEAAAGATRPRVSIVIPVFNRADLTLQCLTSLAEHTGDEIPYEVIIVDNASTDGTAEVLAALEGDVTVLRNEENRGFGEACNQGAAVAAGEYVLFLNNDTMLTPGWLPPLVAALDEEPRRAAVQPKLLYPDGKLNDAGGLVFANGDAWVYGKGSLFPDAPAYSVRRAPDYASGACLLVRKRAFDEIGGFDSRYAPAYYEDTDLSFAFRAAGWTVLYEPASTVIHLEGGTAGTDVTKGLKVYQVRNKDRFTEKWAAELATRPALDPAIVEAWAHRSQGGFGPGEEVALDALTGSRESAWETARTRAQSRRHVLVVDVFTPMYDRASGHLRAFQLVRSLRAAGHTVTYFAAALCIERARYAAALSRIGVALYGRDPEEVELANQLPQDLQALWSQLYSPTVEAMAHRHGIDTVLFTPWVSGEQVAPIIRRVLPDATVVIDSCDLHFVREEREAQLTGDPKAIADAADRKRRELAVYGAADAVVVVSDKEAEVLSAELPDARIVVIGNAHDEKPLGPGFAERSGLLFVGNANHSPNVDAVSWWAEEIAPRLAELLPGVPLTVVGNDPRGELAGLRTGNVDVVGWVPDTLPYLHRARISVAPLRYGAGVKGKVGEALAAGLPVVGTTIAVEGMGLRDGEHVLVADDPETFARQVARLYSDAELWEKLRAAGPQHLSGMGGLKDMAAAAADLLADPEHPQWTAVPARWSSPLYRSEDHAAPAAPAAPAAAPSVPLTLPTAPNGKVRVNLACGDDRRPGWLNVDAHTPADLNMDLLDMRFADATVDEILLSHALEHFSESQFRRVLKECRRVLRAGGRLLVNVPDLEWVMRNWLALPEQNRWDWALATVFGLQDNPGEFHRTGFSVRRLERVLLEAGFAEARVSQIFSHGQGCLWAEAYPTPLEAQPSVSALISPNTGEGLEAVLDELQRILPEGADLVVSERLGTAGAVLARTALPVTWLHNVDGITEEDGLAQAASVARADLVLPVRFGRMPKQSDIVARAKVAKRPKPTGLIPASVRDWKIYQP